MFSVLRTPDEVRRFGRAVKVGRFKVQNKSLKKSKRTREKRKEDVCNRFGFFFFFFFKFIYLFIYLLCSGSPFLLFSFSSDYVKQLV